MTANAIVTPNQTPPAGAERGINRANAPKISTSPVTIRTIGRFRSNRISAITDWSSARMI